jgi:eukaryotic-like serine/threonine-protein kinase
MTPERWKRVEKVFESALEHPPAERPAFLDAACQGDSSLRNQVQTLLMALDRPNTAAVSSSFATPTTDKFATPAHMIGKRLGAYRIVQEIGRGGMGSVFLAFRADDEYQKRVAIKLIRKGIDNDFLIRRFRNERQILATLDHPNVASLLDGGTTEEGLPYFVMEYVEGQPLFSYCDSHRLSVAERLKLFRKVCSAVNYAHQHRIIHRDLKPSNVLVTTEGVPKLLDFGIAKLLDPDLAHQTLDPTTAAVRLMTPEYASPEQVLGETVTISSDVYSLGVMLYELLTDHRPYRLTDKTPYELARVICEQDPDLPSVAVNLIEVIVPSRGEPFEVTPSTVSEARSTSPEQLKRELAGSLDSIVLKAMRKEPEKRYTSVEEFSADLGRYLEGVPVAAPSFFHPSAIPQVDTGDPESRSLAVLPFQVLRVEEKSDEFLGMGMADAIITKLSNIHRIMVRPTSSIIKYFDGTHNILAAGHELGVAYVLDGRIQRAGDRIRLTVQLVRMRDGVPLWATKFDENYTDIFSLEDSISEQVADALIPRLSGEERELLLRRETENADAYQAYLKGRYFWNRFTNEDLQKSLEHFREAIRIDPDYALPYVGIADYFNWAAIYSIGAPKEYFPQAKEAATKALALDDSLAEAHAALAFTTLLYDWDWEKSEAAFKRALELNPNYGPAHQWYSNLLAAQGRFFEAVTEIKRAQELNPLSLIDASIGGWTFYHARQYEKAISEADRATEMDRTFGNSHMILSIAYEELGEHDKAIAMAQKAQELMEGSVLPLWALGYALARSGRTQEAEAVAEKLKTLATEIYISPYYQAVVYTGLGDRDTAFAYLEKAFDERDEWLIWLGTEPKLDDLRSDPRFAELIKRVGLKGDEVAKATSFASGDWMPARTMAAVLPGPIEISSAPTTAGGYVDHPSQWRAWIYGAAFALVLVAIAFGVYRFTRTPISHFSATNINKLTATGNIMDVAISPDGKYAAYVMVEGGKQGLWVKQVSIANNIRLVAPNDAHYQDVTFSRDGDYIYYVRYEANAKDGKLFRVPALGGSVSELKNDVDSGIGFSQDGKQFAFVRSNPDKGEDILMIANAQSGEEKQIASRKFPEHFSVLATPAWSPDGTTVTAVTQTSDENGFYLKIDGFDPTSLATKSMSPHRWLEVNAMSWLADGTGLVISAQESTSAFYRLWLLTYPGPQERMITNDVNDYLAASVSATIPPTLLSVQRQTLTNIWLSPKNDITHPVQLTSGAGMFFDLCWTYDGKILYASDASGNADIWEMNGDGSNPRQLTAGAGRNYAPVISPDGRYIVFHSNRSGRWQLWRMDRDGGNQIQLTSDTEESNWPEFSRDGRTLYFEHVNSGVPTLWKMSIDGGKPEQVTTNLALRPATSPDGKSLAYWQRDQRPNAPWRIALMPLDQPTGQTKYFDVPQSIANGQSALQISPDQTSILFIDYRNGVSNLMSQPLNGGPTEQLTNFTKEQFYSFDLSTDGRLIVSRGIRTTDAVLISERR